MKLMKEDNLLYAFWNSFAIVAIIFTLYTLSKENIKSLIPSWMGIFIFVELLFAGIRHFNKIKAYIARWRSAK